MRPAQRLIIGEIQRLHARRAPLNISAVKRNHPQLMDAAYSVRPFWGWKRALEDAGLDYKTINTELRDYVECKICGRDFGALSAHLIGKHQINPEDYRLEYPKAELHCETMRARATGRRSHLDAMPHWEAIWTAEYVLDRMAELHRRNFPLNFLWAKRKAPRLVTQAVLYFDSWDEALRRIGLDPTKIRRIPPSWPDQRPWWRVGKAAILAELRRRKAAGESVARKKIERGSYGCSFVIRARRLFGSWTGALAAAGLDPSGGRDSQWLKAGKAAIFAEIRRRQRSGEPLACKSIQKEKWGVSLVGRSAVLFGSWSDALLALGIEPRYGKSPWPYADKADVLAELRRRKRAGETLLSHEIVKETWGKPLQDRCRVLFGSYGAAQHAAGIEPAKEQSPWVRADKAAILAEIRRRKRARKSLRSTLIRSEKWGQPLLARAVSLFGCWGAALLAAGVDPSAGTTSRWLKADKAAVLAEVRRRKRLGQSLRFNHIAREQWGAPFLHRAQTLFGSWDAAVHAARTPPDKLMKLAQMPAR